MEVRRTKWLPYGYYGYAKYRVWKRVQDGIWQQRHEWERVSGHLETGQWIASSPQFIDGMENVSEQN